jgi:hypothetical protein
MFLDLISFIICGKYSNKVTEQVPLVVLGQSALLLQNPSKLVPVSLGLGDR